MKVYLIMTKPLPSPEEQSYGLAWWNMEFVKVNDRPVPFLSLEAAEEYMRLWNMPVTRYTVWELSRAECATNEPVKPLWKVI